MEKKFDDIICQRLDAVVALDRRTELANQCRTLHDINVRNWSV